MFDFMVKDDALCFQSRFIEVYTFPFEPLLRLMCSPALLLVS